MTDVDRLSNKKTKMWKALFLCPEIFLLSQWVGKAYVMEKQVRYRIEGMKQAGEIKDELSKRVCDGTYDESVIREKVDVVKVVGSNQIEIILKKGR